jgi:fucose permease
MEKDSFRLTIMAFLSLAMVGIFHTILGTALPAMEVSFEMSTTRAGLLGSAAWLGFTTAVFAGGALSDIFTRHRVLMLACLMIGSCAILLGLWRTFWFNCLLVGVVGAGTGIIVSSSSALILALYPRREGMIMNVHHFFYAIGAIVGPLAMGYILKRGWPWQWVYRTGGMAMLSLAVWFASFRGRGTRGSALNYGSFFRLVREKNLILLILVAIFGLGTQNGLFFWLVSFLTEVRLFPIFYAGLGLSLFAFGMAAGRLLSGWVTAKFGNTRVLLMLLVLLNLVLFLFLAVASRGWTLAFCFMGGIACSGLFPGLLALGGINYPHLSGTTVGILGTAAGVGSTLMPWIMSAVSQPTSLKAGFGVSGLAAFSAFALMVAAFNRFQESEKGG